MDKDIKSQYSAFADCYEYFAAYCDYDKWSQYVLTVLKRNAVGRSGIDLACGSGYFTRAMKKAGYNVTGVDLSPEMLFKAQNLSVKENLDIEYIRGDLTAFKPFNKVDFVTVINDGLNYVDFGGVKKCFSNVYKYLVKGGYFVFDISSEYKLKNVIGNNMFGEDDEDFTYMWFNTLYEDKVVMDLTFFEREGKMYKRFDERHTEYIHDKDEILNLLKETGFEIVSVNGLYDEPLTDETDRVVFTVKKV